MPSMAREPRSSSQFSKSIPAAGRRNNSIHAHVLDHLPVVIHEVRQAKSGHARTRSMRSLRERILRGDSIHIGMRLLERVLQRLKNLRLAAQLVDGVFLG